MQDRGSAHRRRVLPRLPYGPALSPLRDVTGQSRGTEQIDGRAVSVFEAQANGERCVAWADRQTGLLVRAQMHMQKFTEADRPIVLHDFRYGVEPDDSLFSLTPPAGCALEEKRLDAAEPPRPTGQDLVGILGVWADLADGAFPAACGQWSHVGQGVKPGDPDRPICWWKNPDADTF